MRVVVAIIRNENHEILITKRNAEASFGGLWEFPGGKIEPNESAESALIREVLEEVNLKVISYEFLTQVDYQYPEKFVSLMVYNITEYQGNAQCSENQQALLWVNPQELRNFEYPKANATILNLTNS